MNQDLVVAITGASGAIYAVRLIQVLLFAGRTVHVTISPAATQVLDHELGLKVNLDGFAREQLLPAGTESTDDLEPSGFAMSSVLSDSDISRGQLVYHHYADFTAGIASGSFRTEGMVICPCSLGTLGSLANGLSSNLIHRAAAVHLKEQRKLIVVPRDTPLDAIALGNMQKLAEVGAVVLPAMPGFYHGPATIHQLVDFVVARICDQLVVENDLVRRWGEDA